MTEDAIIQEVVRRLTLPRVGLICDEIISLPRPDAFTWVLYPRKCEGENKNARVYPLPKIARPENEGAALSVLVALEMPLTVTGELLDGVPRSSEGALILGCLGRGVPVLMQSSLSAWKWYNGTACGKHLASRLERLQSWGLHVLDLDFSASAAETMPETQDIKPKTQQIHNPAGPSKSLGTENKNSGDLTLRGPGWVTWSELNGRLQNISSIRLEGGVKLTMEARDQLVRYGIALHEV